VPLDIYREFQLDDMLGEIVIAHTPDNDFLPAIVMAEYGNQWLDLMIFYKHDDTPVLCRAVRPDRGDRSTESITWLRRPSQRTTST
jgi:hypothetical protein